MPWWLERGWLRTPQARVRPNVKDALGGHFKFDFDFLYTIGRPSATAEHISFGAQMPFAMDFRNTLQFKPDRAQVRHRQRANG